ncbi:hypothetical protein JAAARDRAFT_198063 [Jaapia argillacea MUCL 33604]|uniref:DUF6533 domain-containing protein n=1 Tax=Jaapia argillacea MUCL 33604 TaxID=933084 RepID=A0A067PD57_9AGAM|nr:hypothetical protein JAAARDRAFT_198063 [Jaapia argillacea MUCL 33604]
MALAAQCTLMINYSSLSSITFLVWDILLTLDDEVAYIWPQHKRSPSKWLFLFTRYFSLACQVSVSRFLPHGLDFDRPISSNIPRVSYLRSLGVLGASHHSHRSCLWWLIFQSISLQALVTAVELILSIRVYALYAGSRHIRMLIVALFTFELTMAIPCLSISLSRARFANGFLFVLALYKSVKAIRMTQGKSRVATIVARDSLWVFFLITLILVLEGLLYQSLGPVMQTWIFTWMMSIFTFSVRPPIKPLHLAANTFSLRAKESEEDEAVLTSNLEGILLDVFDSSQMSIVDLRACDSRGRARLRVGAHVDDTSVISKG